MSSKELKGSPITKETVLEVGQVLFGKTSENEPANHYKVIFAIANNKVQFIGISSTYKDGFKVTSKDFIGNNHVNGYINRDFIDSKTINQLEELSNKDKIILKPYRATPQLLRKIQDILDHMAQLNKTIDEKEEEIAKLKEEIENSKNKQEFLDKAKDIFFKILKVLLINLVVILIISALVEFPILIIIMGALCTIYTIKNQTFRKNFIEIFKILLIEFIIFLGLFATVTTNGVFLIIIAIGYFIFKKSLIIYQKFIIMIMR